MKIAAATNDGANIAADFGDAAYYAVLTVEAGSIVVRELRQKQPQGWYRVAGHAEHRGPAGAVPEAVHRHDDLADPINDCQAVLVAGISGRDREHLETVGIWPIVTYSGPIDAAVQAFLAGELVAS
ncbi:MAG TPA: NifB/NifX family molybdenum-iron cluster-binding protein [Anaerolineae bacterium]|nr:NifB/NifX family molybdenum-iron cluster-binding protein [Anaerolineae bacterium]HOQ99033.1 NifB/NifX family molybdenum-iron cluster-binding protein [Anaerolineae bacterium]HPL29258.1 NifB/NifX family molybdenum-iron cluster-binding protein [Anaerolineae bacterium]